MYFSNQNFFFFETNIRFAASKEILSTQFNTFIGIILGHFSFLIEQEEHENKYFVIFYYFILFLILFNIHFIFLFYR